MIKYSSRNSCQIVYFKTVNSQKRKRKLAERSPQDGGRAQKAIIGPRIQESVRSACDAILEQFKCTLTTKLDTVVNKLDTLIECIASVDERVTRLEAANKKLADENTELKKEMSHFVSNPHVVT